MFLSVGIAEHTVGSGPDNVSRSYLEETTSLSYLTEDMNAKCLWKLGLDEETNSSLRDQFYYEQVSSRNGQHRVSHFTTVTNTFTVVFNS